MLLLVLGLSFTNEDCEVTIESQVCEFEDSSRDVSINMTDYCSQFGMIKVPLDGDFVCTKECTSIQSCHDDFAAHYGNSTNFMLTAARSLCNESNGCATTILMMPTIFNCSCAPNHTFTYGQDCNETFDFIITQSHCTGDMITLWPPSAVPYTAPTASPTTPLPADNTVLIVIIVVGVVLAGAGILYYVVNRKRPNNAANAASLLDG